MKVYPRKDVDQDVYSLGLERVEQLAGQYDHLAVSFSGGKDSTATLMTALDALNATPALRRHLPLDVAFADEEAIPYETEEYVRRISERDDVNLRWYCIPFKENNACSRSAPYWYPWAPEDEDKWVRPMPPEALTTLEGFPTARNDRVELRLTTDLMWPPTRGRTAVMLGIRAAESSARYRSVARRAGELDNWISPARGRPIPPAVTERVIPGIFKAYPIYDWSTQDVWTAPKLKGWDYNRAYDALEMAGVPVTGQRCSPPFGNEPLQKLHTYATCFPDIWDRMLDRAPGVAAAARYATTELYGYHGTPPKPEGLSWPDFIKHYVAQHEPGFRVKTAERVRFWIRNHYAKTTDPILPNAPHPDSGVSWEWLTVIAMRGDRLNRKQAGTRVDAPWHPGYKVAWEKYLAEKATYDNPEGRKEIAWP